MRIGNTEPQQRHGARARTTTALGPALLLACLSCASDGPEPGSGQPAMSCDELAQAYLQAVDEARDCDPQLGEAQCTVPVDQSLSCPCRMYVKHGAPLDRLLALEQSFLQQQCSREPCADTCANPYEGVCTIKLGNLTAGRCESR